MTTEEMEGMQALIRACIERLERRENAALKAAMFTVGSRHLPRPVVRQEIRAWFGARKQELWREFYEARKR